jgi:hypothetical protein
MKILQSRIAVTVPVHIVPIAGEDTAVWVDVSNGTIGTVSKDGYAGRLVPEIVSAVRAAVDWDAQ